MFYRLHLYTIPGIICLTSYSYTVYKGSTSLKEIKEKQTKIKP